MINKVCEICNEYNISDNWVLRIYDEKESVEFNGHKSCIDNLDIKVKNIKELHKQSVKQVLKIIKLKER